MEENTTVVKNTTPVGEDWNSSVKKIGVSLLIAGMIASFLPFLYVYFVHGVAPSLSNMMAAWGAIAATYIAFYVIEPISYYPSLGMSGSYMTWIAGSSSSMRVPAAVVAKDLANVQDGTQEAEIISTAAVGGSVVMSTLMVALAAVAGTSILALLPETIKSAMTSYIAPSIFGAVFAMFSESKPKLAIPAFIGAFCLNYLVRSKILLIPSWGVLIICVAAVMIFARVLYKAGKI